MESVLRSLNKYSKTVESWHTLSSRCADCNAITRLEQIGLTDGIMHLGFEDVEKAITANLLACFWTL